MDWIGMKSFMISLVYILIIIIVGTITPRIQALWLHPTNNADAMFVEISSMQRLCLYHHQISSMNRFPLKAKSLCFEITTNMRIQTRENSFILEDKGISVPNVK